MIPFGVFFGWPAGGVWANLVASAIWALPGGIALWRKLRCQHAERVAQAERHHREQMALAKTHQQELRQQAERHHLQALDRLEAHTAELKAHVTAAIPTRKVSRSD